jgi:hypothetical protein
MSPTSVNVLSEDVEEASDHPDYVRYGSYGYQMIHSHFVFGDHDWSSENALADNYETQTGAVVDDKPRRCSSHKARGLPSHSIRMVSRSFHLSTLCPVFFSSYVCLCHWPRHRPHREQDIHRAARKSYTSDSLLSHSSVDFQHWDLWNRFVLRVCLW